MILTVDVGNTQITGGLFDEDGKLVLQFRRTTHMGTSSDELGLFFRSVIRENGFHWQKIQRIGVCSVVPSINYSLQSAFTKYFNCRALFIQAGIKTGLKLRYANPKEIGADRIAANGDTANKIGTYTVAIAAKYHNVPFYIAAPLSTIDTSIKSGKEIPIEERSHEEVTHINGKPICAEGVNIINPGFDVTPNELITGIITEVGILKPDYNKSIKEAFEKKAGVLV